jgi:hypothetical protein
MGGVGGWEEIRMLVLAFFLIRKDTAAQGSVM